MKITDGVLYLHGTIDEFVDLTPYQGANQPGRINLRGVKAINSMGILRFHNFAQSWRDRKIELLECSQVIVDAINTFPGLLGQPPVPSRVSSMLLPFFCGVCGKGTEHLIDTRKVEANRPELISAPVCCRKMDLEGHFEDYFLYLEVLD